MSLKKVRKYQLQLGLIIPKSWNKTLFSSKYKVSKLFPQANQTQKFPTTNNLNNWMKSIDNSAIMNNQKHSSVRSRIMYKKLKQQFSKDDDWASSTTQSYVKPALNDAAVDHFQVRLEDTSRLRKLKKQEAELEITGQQYIERFQDYYTS